MLVDAGIVDDDIEWSVLRHDRLNHAGVADIEVNSGRTDLPGKTGGRFEIEIGNHDMGARLGKASRDRRTDALRATGDEGAAAIEPPEGRVPEAGTISAP